jgi:hypothetical protein
MATLRFNKRKVEFFTRTLLVREDDPPLTRRELAKLRISREQLRDLFVDAREEVGEVLDVCKTRDGGWSPTVIWRKAASV